MPEKIQTLGEMLPIEQARARELLVTYKELGPVGVFGATHIEDTLKKADQAVIQGDLVAMIQIYQDLKGLE